MASLTVLYEDNHCLAVAKPAGLLTVGDETGDDTLLDQARRYLKKKYNKPGNVFLGVVHRLDRPVSGVVLFARTSKAASRLTAQFRDGTVTKTYLARVIGVPEPTRGSLHHWLLKNDQTNVVRVVPAGTPKAKEARLDYELQERTGQRSVLMVRPRTGRSHQIRVQLAEIGCPIVGDTKYGGPRGRKPGTIALHASELRFGHPTRADELTVSCPIPREWSH